MPRRRFRRRRGRRKFRRARKSGYVRRLVAREFRRRTEKKSRDQVGNGTADLAGDFVLGLAQIPKGAGPGERVGRRVNLKSVVVRGAIHQAASGNDVGMLRILLVKWNAADVAPTSADVLEYAGDPVSPYRTKPVHPYLILYDRIYSFGGEYQTFNAAAPFPGGVVWKPTRHYIPFIIRKRLGFSARFDGDATTDGTSGQVYLIIVSDLAQTSTASVGCRSRIRYTDM